MADKIKETEQSAPQNPEKELKENITPKIFEKNTVEIQCALIEGRVNYII
jgi:hypothetical protein